MFSLHSAMLVSMFCGQRIRDIVMCLKNRKFQVLAPIAISINLFVSVMSVAAPSDTWYVGAKAGLVSALGACEPHALTCDTDTADVGLFIGYNLSNWLALEIGYDDLGTIKADYPALNHPTVIAPYEGKMRGIELLAKPYWQLNERSAVFAKAGVLTWNMDVTGEEVGFTHEASDRGVSPLLGIGMEYAFNRNWYGLLEYQWAGEVGGNATGEMDLGNLNVGIAYRFDSTGKPKAPATALAVSAVVPNPESPASVTTSAASADAVITSKELVSTTDVDASESGGSLSVNLAASESEAVAGTFTASHAHALPPMAMEAARSFHSIFFDSEDSTLSSAQLRLLQAPLKHMRTFAQAHLIIRAHTDSLGLEAYNQRLSEQRAEAIRHYFVTQGIEAVRLTTVGMGEQEPIADNHVREGRERNRRVELFSPAQTTPVELTTKN